MKTLKTNNMTMRVAKGMVTIFSSKLIILFTLFIIQSCSKEDESIGKKETFSIDTFKQIVTNPIESLNDYNLSIHQNKDYQKSYNKSNIDAAVFQN